MTTTMATKITASAQPAFDALTVIRLIRASDIAGKHFPKGTAGTIVHVYAGGGANEVEIAVPHHIIATLQADDLAA